MTLLKTLKLTPEDKFVGVWMFFLPFITVIVFMSLGAWLVSSMNNNNEPFNPGVGKERYKGVEERIAADERIDEVVVYPYEDSGYKGNSSLQYKVFISVKPDFSSQAVDVAADAVKVVYANGNYDGGIGLEEIDLNLWTQDANTVAPFQGGSDISYERDLNALKFE